MNWNLNQKNFKCNWSKLAKKLDMSLQELNECWNRGGIFVFNNLDEICSFYDECQLDIPSTDILKEEIKQGTVIYTQHKFFMFS